MTADQISEFIRGYNQGSIPDYQMSALAMAILWRGMSPAETAILTEEMLNSGVRLQWPNDGTLRVDKHSTGGVGDKVSLILAPLLACCGVQVPMLSGRGLGPTGGTLDKLESIPGFRTDLTLVEIQQVTAESGCVITGASQELAPADRKLYALRDVTGTVPSVPLITASIMSKKLSESLDALVLDVKVGSGAFMKTMNSAQELALSLVRTGARMGVKTCALITDMNQPLGRMIGNTVEVRESIDVLSGRGPHDVKTLSLELAVELLAIAQPSRAREAIQTELESHLDSGRALEAFEKFVAAQGGRLHELVQPAPALEISARADGYVKAIDTEALGMAVIELGGGRQQAGATIDHAVGLEVCVRIGDLIKAGQTLFRIFSDQPKLIADRIHETVEITSDRVSPPPLVHKRLTGQPNDDN